MRPVLSTAATVALTLPLLTSPAATAAAQECSAHPYLGPVLSVSIGYRGCRVVQIRAALNASPKNGYFETWGPAGLRGERSETLVWTLRDVAVRKVKPQATNRGDLWCANFFENGRAVASPACLTV